MELKMAEVKQVRLENQNEQSATLLPETVEHGKDEVDFGSAEHDCIGDKVKLPNGLKYIKLPNGVELTLGQIIELAGDFYGIPEHPIIDPSKGMNQVDSGRNPRFSEAYNTLARAPKDELQKELNKILTTLRKDRQTGTSTKAEKWDKITGGKWLCGVPYKPGRMLKLAEDNHDHFLPYAKEAYLTGHQLAMDKAREASTSDSTEWEKLLHEALSLDAFACHFLTDSFASGHIRTPRVELATEGTFAQVGHLLSKCMHDEDCKYGLHVTNRRGDKWVAYGDGMLLDEKSKDNLRLAIEAVQKSVDQVFEAFEYPSKALDTAEVTDLVPIVDQADRNHFPLFEVKCESLYRRSDFRNLQDGKTTRKWWGVTTVLSFLRSETFVH